MRMWIMRIEWTVWNVLHEAGKRQFSIVKSDWTMIDIVIPERMKHMMNGIVQWVGIVIDNTLSWPKAISVYSNF